LVEIGVDDYLTECGAAYRAVNNAGFVGDNTNKGKKMKISQNGKVG